MKILKVFGVCAYLINASIAWAAPTTSESAALLQLRSLSAEYHSPRPDAADAQLRAPTGVLPLEKRTPSPGRIADKIKEGFQQMGQKIKSGFQAAGQAIKDTGQKAVQGVQDKIVKPIENKVVQPIQQKVVKPAVDALKKAPAAIKTQVGGNLKKGGQEIKKQVGGGLRKGGEEIKKQVGGNLKKGAQVIKHGLQAAKNKVVGGLQKMGKSLGELGRKAREALRPQRRLNDQQRGVVKQVFKFFGEMVGALGCMTAKLIPGANVAVELVCAASAVAETTVDAVKAGQQKKAPEGTKAASAVNHGTKAAEGIAKANNAEKTLGILGKASKVLKLIRILPFRKRDLEEPIAPTTLSPVEKRGLGETAFSKVKLPLRSRSSAGNAPRTKVRPSFTKKEGLRPRSGSQAPMRPGRFRRRQLQSNHRCAEQLRYWKREAEELFPAEQPLRKRKRQIPTLSAGLHQSRRRSP